MEKGRPNHDAYQMVRRDWCPFFVLFCNAVVMSIQQFELTPYKAATECHLSTIIRCYLLLCSIYFVRIFVYCVVAAVETVKCIDMLWIPLSIVDTVLINWVLQLCLVHSLRLRHSFFRIPRTRRAPHTFCFGEILLLWFGMVRPTPKGYAINEYLRISAVEIFQLFMLTCSIDVCFYNQFLQNHPKLVRNPASIEISLSLQPALDNTEHILTMGKQERRLMFFSCNFNHARLINRNLCSSEWLSWKGEETEKNADAITWFVINVLAVSTPFTQCKWIICIFSILPTSLYLDGFFSTQAFRGGLFPPLTR